MFCDLTFNHGKKVKKAHKSVLAICCDKITNDSPNEYTISKKAFDSLLYLFEFVYNNTKLIRIEWKRHTRVATVCEEITPESQDTIALGILAKYLKVYI